LTKIKLTKIKLTKIKLTKVKRKGNFMHAWNLPERCPICKSKALNDGKIMWCSYVKCYWFKKVLSP